MKTWNRYVVKYVPIVLFLSVLVVYETFIRGGRGGKDERQGVSETARRWLSEEGGNETCGDRLQRKFECEEAYCGDKVSGNINYLRMAYCDLEGTEAVSYFITIPWLIYLLYLLADTADAFFVPVLEHIVEHFNVPPSIAGITFLSFGNGAPDVFSAVVAYSSGSGGDIGLGALLGSGAYVTCVICAVIAYYAPEDKCTLYRRPFVRDVIFYLITLTYMAALFIAKVTITAEYAIVFVLLYVGYILFVVVARQVYQTRKIQKRIERRILHMESANSNADDVGGKHAEFTRVESAIDDWGYSGFNSFVVKRTSDIHAAKNAPKTWSERIREVVGIARKMNSGVLSHRIVNDDDDDGGGDVSGTRRLRSFRTARTPSKAHGGRYALTRYASDVETRNVKRVLVATPSPVPSSSASKDDDDEEDDDSALRRIRDDDGSDTLHAPLIVSGDEDEEEDEDAIDLDSKAIVADAGNEKRPPATLRSWYRDWREEFAKSPLHYKVLSLVLAPACACRALSIPLASEEEWCREAAVLSPILGSLVTCFALDPTTTVGGCPVEVIAILCGFLCAAVMYRLTRENTDVPPQNPLFITFFLALGFLMSILWIYLIANEIVSVLECLGFQLSISETALGLTVLAWANSAPDTISIAAIAREGKVQMAIGGVYAGRMFDTAMGLGLGMFISALQGQPVPFGKDATAIPSFVTLFLSVGAALVVVPMSGFRYTKKFGLCLVALYAIFMPIALLVSFGVF
eukprot:g1851.t1